MSQTEKNRFPLTWRKWISALLCVWIAFAMLLAYIIFDGPVFSSLDKIGFYHRFKTSLCWTLGENSDEQTSDQEAGE